MSQAQGELYLGRHYDLEAGQTTAEPLVYEADDLTTHGVVVGMTGSGKTGLCIDLLEEAALSGIPAIMIDPKGDITNTLLHFPDLLPADFAPWVNPDEARRAGKPVEELARETAERWREGLAGWDITPERISTLKESAQFTVYTPGSDAGVSISILASLGAPALSWEGNAEIIRERISSTVTALLGLIGLHDVDPVQSREHILLSNIFEAAWRQGHDLNLGEIIMQTQTPPFEKLGFFDVETFFPQKERFALAMRLNSLLAAPAFQTWIEGEPLDPERLLYTPDGRPRHSVFYLAHLSDAERMFFVTLLFGTIETWMRTQSGTTSLRALVYFDEIFGYLPPVGQPPSKKPMLRMLKQARAFGVGLLLATQNPVDVDYKALSNAGTWFIGKLGTEQDKQRLLDGLASAVPGGLARAEYDHLISALGKRVFLLRNVHEPQPQLFQTRWAMNYLAGPLTRTQIPALNALAGVGTTPSAPAAPQAEAVPAAAPPLTTAAAEPALPGTRTPPAAPSGVSAYFLPDDLTLTEAGQERSEPLPPEVTEQGLLYRPALLAQAVVHFTNRKYDLDAEREVAALLTTPDRPLIRWEDNLTQPVDPRALLAESEAEGRFVSLPSPLSDGTALRALRSDFTDWIYRAFTLPVKVNEQLGLHAGPDVDEETFRRMCLEAAEDEQEKEVDKLEASYRKKLDTLQTKLTREERELREDEAELSRRKQEETASYADTLFGLFRSRRRSLSTPLTKRRMTARAREDVQEGEEEIRLLKRDLEKIQAEMEQALDKVEEKWQAVAEDIAVVQVSPYKKDIDLQLFGIAWLPHHLLQVGDDFTEVAAFSGAR